MTDADPELPVRDSRATDFTLADGDDSRDHSLRSIRSVIREAVAAASSGTSSPAPSSSFAPPTIVTAKRGVRMQRLLRPAATDGSHHGEVVIEALEEERPATPITKVAGWGPSKRESSVGMPRPVAPSRAENFQNRLIQIATRAGYVLAILQLAIVLSLVGAQLMVNSRLVSRIKMSYVVTEDDESVMTTYAFALRVYEILFFVAQLFQFYLFIDATVTSNRPQLLVSATFVIFSLADSCVHVYQQQQYFTIVQQRIPQYKFGSQDALSLGLGYSLMVCTIMFTFAWGILGGALFAGMRWQLYKETGADPRTRHRYAFHHAFLVALKLATFLQISFGILLYFMAVGGLKWQLFSQFTLAFDGLMVAAGLWLLCYVGVDAAREQSASSMCLFVVGCIVEVVFILEFVFSVSSNDANGAYPADTAGTKDGVLAFAVLSAVGLIAAGVIGGINAYYYVRDPRVQIGDRRSRVGSTATQTWSTLMLTPVALPV